MQGKNVAYLYLSLDKGRDEKKWREAALKDKIVDNQYLLMDDFSSLFVKYLKVGSIPRYLILGKDHIMKSFDAPRPTPNQLKNLKMAVSGALLD